MKYITKTQLRLNGKTYPKDATVELDSATADRIAQVLEPFKAPKEDHLQNHTSAVRNYTPGPQEIKTAVLKLDPNNDEHWTKEGLPSMKAVEAILGVEIKRAEVSDAAGGITRENIKSHQEK